MNWNMIKNIMITCIFVVALLISWNWNTSQINELKDKLETSEYQLECHKIALNEAKKIISTLENDVKLKKNEIKPVIEVNTTNIYKELILKHDLYNVHYMFKKGSMGATLYCVDNHNNQIGYIDISSGILVKTPQTYWGTARESKFLLVWKRK